MSARSMESLIYDAPDGRFAGIRRDYGVEQVVALRGTLSVRYTRLPSMPRSGSGICSPPRTTSTPSAR